MTGDTARYALGIDLGTTYTAAAVWRGQRAEVIPLDSAGRGVPSVVLVEDDGRTVIGPDAERRSAGEQGRVARAFKRRFGDEVGLFLAGREVLAEDLTAALLRWVVAAVTKRLGDRPTAVVVTVPATWQGYRLGLMQQVIARADLGGPAVTLLPEPAAAAIYYAGREHVSPGTQVAVYDFGGGTFDATVMAKTKNGFEITGLPRGDESIGGIDIDFRLLRLVARQAGPGWAALDRGDERVRTQLAALNASVVAAKESLSTASTVSISIELPGIPSSIEVSRKELEDEAQPLLEATIKVMRDVIATAGLEPDQLDRVLLVGGSSQMPLVRRVIEQELAVPVVDDAHPKYAVCLGAAVAAGALIDENGGDGGGQAPSMPAPTSSAGTAMEVNLGDAGLTEAATVPVRPAAQLRRRPEHPPDEPLVAHLGGTDVTQGRPLAVTTIGVALAVTAILMLFASLAFR